MPKQTAEEIQADEDFWNDFYYGVWPEPEQVAK